MTTNAITFIGLCNEYCVAVENARETDRDEFVNLMLRLLPRLYITATDLVAAGGDEPADDVFLADALDEDYYEALRRNMEELLGPDDVYLEVFEEDMKYSDTPVATSVSEGLADIFQSLYNFISTVRDSTDEVVAGAIATETEEFRSFWSSRLCNTLRALNHIRYN